MTTRASRRLLGRALLPLAAVLLFSAGKVGTPIRQLPPDDEPGGHNPGCLPWSADCAQPPTMPAVATPPQRALPPGAPGAAVCGTCTSPAGTPCFWGQDCDPNAICEYQPICQPNGLCYLPEPELGSYVDARCVPRQAGEPDDTCRLKRAAERAAGRVLWIAAGSVFEVSNLGAASCPEPLNTSAGVPIPSHTIVAGGGTIRLHVDPAQREAELNVGGCLLKIQDATDVTLTGITLDGAAGDLQCPDTKYPGRCEYKHALGMWDASDVTIAGCSFVNLVGDGTYTNGAHSIPGPIWIHDSFFAAHPSYRNRNGVSVARVHDMRVEHNTFVGLARKPMPGAIDFEANLSSDRTERVIVSGNEITGWSGCFNSVGISASNNVNAYYSDILFAGNHVTGCQQIGILVNGAGTIAGPVVFRDNLVETDSPPDRQEWGIAVGAHMIRAGGRVVARLPAHAFVKDNVVRMNRAGLSTNVMGLAVYASGAIVEGNTFEESRNWGIVVDERYEHLGTEPIVVNFDERMFCGNTVRHAGIPGRNDTGAILVQGGNMEFYANQVEASPEQPTPQGGTVVYGSCNLFQGNTFDDVTNCGNPYIGCVVCGASAGCQRFDGNTGGPTMTTCTPCP